MSEYIIHHNKCSSCGALWTSDQRSFFCTTCTAKGLSVVFIVGGIIIAAVITLGNIFSVETIKRYGYQTWWSNIISLQTDEDLLLNDSFILLSDADQSTSTNVSLPRGVCLLNKGQLELKTGTFIAVEFYANTEERFGFIKLPTYTDANASLAVETECPQIGERAAALQQLKRNAMLAELSVQTTTGAEARKRTEEMGAFYAVDELSNSEAELTAWIPKEQESIVNAIRQTYSLSNNQDLFYQSNPTYRGVLSQ